MSKSLYIILIFICLCLSVTAQEKEQAITEKVTPRMSLVSTQLNNDSVLIETTLKVKIEGAWQPVDFELVKFSTLQDSITKPLGESLTSDKGVASLKVGRNQLFMSSDSVWMVGSVFEGSKKLEGGEASLSIKPAMATLSGEMQDSIYSLTLKLLDAGIGNAPLADVEVGFYVKRHFSNLKIGEGTTDENGEVTIECPGDIPGDAEGNIVLIGRAEDMDEYGSIAAVVVKPWGVPLQEADQKVTRALWAHAPPVWMLVTFIILMSVVWGHYIVIIYKLIKLRKPKIQNP